MTKHFTRSLPSGPPNSTLPAVLTTALKPMRRDRGLAVIQAQDTFLAAGRRVIFEGGNKGRTSFQFSDDAEPGSDTNLQYPTSTERTYGRARGLLTPGYRIRGHALVLPSGPVESVGAEIINDDGVLGIIGLECTFTDSAGATNTVEREVVPPPSLRENGAVNTAAGGYWSELRPIDLGIIEPSTFLNSPATLNAWSLGTAYNLRVYVKGSPRIVDLVLYEEPAAIAYEFGDTAWAAHIPANPQQAYPLQQQLDTGTDGDERHGSIKIMEVVEQQNRQLGPTLLSWQAWTEDVTDNGLTETDYHETIADASFVALGNQTVTAWASTAPGAATGCGGYGRRHKWGDYEVMRDRSAVMPVIVDVRGYTATSGNDAVVRVQTAADSWIDVDLSDTSSSWHRKHGWLRTAVHPEQMQSMVLLAKRGPTSGNSAKVQSIIVQFDRERAG